MDKTAYSKAQIGLHWAVVGLVALQFILSSGIEAAYDARVNDEPAVRGVLASLHVFLGSTIFVVVAIRLAIRRAEGVPTPAAPTAMLSKVALAVHWAFYALLFTLPVLGGLAWFQSNEGAADLHEIGTKLLLALVVLHAGAALYHHFIEKGSALKRMLP